jgi:hypothetical protein
LLLSCTKDVNLNQARITKSLPATAVTQTCNKRTIILRDALALFRTFRITRRLSLTLLKARRFLRHELVVEQFSSFRHDIILPMPPFNVVNLTATLCETADKVATIRELKAELSTLGITVLNLGSVLVLLSDMVDFKS